MKIKLSDIDYHYLAQASFLNEESKAIIRVGEKKEDFWIITVTIDQADHIREQLQDHFTYCGLDIDYNMTEESKHLDSLIHAFFSG